MIIVNGKILELTNFPNGETKVKLPKEPDFVDMDILWKFESDSELFYLKCVVDAISGYAKTLNLTMPYIPYSRMDRVEDKTTLFTLKSMCAIINDMNFDNVYVTEPHSDVSIALLDRVVVKYVAKELVKLAEKKSKSMFMNLADSYIETILVFPDSGAAKRYGKMFPEYNQVVGFKKRDFESGKITHMEIIGDLPQNGFNAIIVDDLCSYGGTFILAGTELKKLGAKNITLCVAHCEESINKGELLSGNIIDLVVTTNSIISYFNSKKIIVDKAFLF